MIFYNSVLNERVGVCSCSVHLVNKRDDIELLASELRVSHE